MKSNNKKLLIFDMDGTLYRFKEGSFEHSKLNKKIVDNAQKFISKRFDKSKKEVGVILKNIKKEYGDNISVTLEKEYGVNRCEYFGTVWNIPAKNFIQKNRGLKKTLKCFKNKHIMVLVSDAPRIWIESVLKELKIKDIFSDRIFSGEGDRRKEYYNAFEYVSNIFKIKPQNCFVFGDEEKNDIIPAKKIGMKTIFVSEKGKSLIADYNIKNIQGAEKVLDF